jgi:putative ABC transport system permease protein
LLSKRKFGFLRADYLSESDEVFNYSFFNDDFAKLYTSEQRTEQIFSVFFILAIFIACLGLWGLATYNAEQRTKEIGIRKVLGRWYQKFRLYSRKNFLLG